MIQLALSFQNIGSQNEMAQASMNAKGFASNRFVKELGDPDTEKIAFGGVKHADGTGNQKVWKYRPETIKTSSCEGEECTECTDPSSCWHGKGTALLVLQVPPTNPHSRFVFEAWASCGTGGGTWSLNVYNKKFENGHLSVYMNGAPEATITKAEVEASKDQICKKDKKCTKLRKTIELTKDAHVRVEFSRTDPKLDAYALVAFVAENVDSRVDRCMGVKDCLAKLGDGSDDGFKLRSSNKLQLQCVEASDPATISSTCAEWTGCLSEQEQLINIKSILRAAVGTDVQPDVQPEGFLQASLSDITAKPDDEECVDPSIADPESWECECSEQMFAKCSSGDVETCLQNLMCENPGICDSWKQNHCSTSPSLMAQRSAKSAMINGIDNNLDVAMQGKCSQ